ncbi:unnamed protein product, partial [Rotaria magnacalcarata]
MRSIVADDDSISAILTSRDERLNGTGGGKNDEKIFKYNLNAMVCNMMDYYNELFEWCIVFE